MNEFDAQLCKCTLCDIILIDQNSNKDQNIYQIKDETCLIFPNKIINEMQYVKDVAGNYFWACPKCEDDSNLIDL